jgi:phospholipase/carboxylesterase
MPAAPGFTHEYVPGTSGRTLLLLHGTGGNERDLLPLGRALDPDAHLLSPLGKVLENGRVPRFFRRLAEGVFDEEDLVFRAHELADFVTSATAEYGLDPRRVVAVGYSNGANIAGAVLLLRPGVLAGAVLLRAMVPLVPETLPELAGTRVLVASGEHDPFGSPENSAELIALLRRAGAEVTAHSEPAGHELTHMTVEAAKRWLAEKAP